MTFLEHIKNLAIGLTSKEKQELSAYLSDADAEPLIATPTSLRGDWRDAFSPDCDIEITLRENRLEWQREWRSDDFVG